MQVSPETIYRSLFVQSRGVLKRHLLQHLRRQHRFRHARTAAGVHRYRLEPYAVAADVYAQPPHVGRGGWSWYTGSSGWMYRAAVEWLLGLRRQ